MLTGYVHENRKQNPNDSGQFLAGYADGGGESIYDGFFCHCRSSSLARHPHTTPARSFPAPASSAPMHHPTTPRLPPNARLRSGVGPRRHR